MEPRPHRQVIAERVVRLVIVGAVIGIVLVLLATPAVFVLEKAGEAMAEVMD